eukprot:COSAG02_NODE_51755_length_312_cov_0.723005_1_plen_73_part_01
MRLVRSSGSVALVLPGFQRFVAKWLIPECQELPMEACRNQAWPEVASCRLHQGHVSFQLLAGPHVVRALACCC